MTSVQRQSCFAQRGQASEAPTGPSSNRSDNRDHENPLGSNESGPSEASAEAPIGPFQALPPKTEMDIARFIQKDLDQIIQSLF